MKRSEDDDILVEKGQGLVEPPGKPFANLGAERSIVVLVTVERGFPQAAVDSDQAHRPKLSKSAIGDPRGSGGSLKVLPLRKCGFGCNQRDSTVDRALLQLDLEPWFVEVDFLFRAEADRLLRRALRRARRRKAALRLKPPRPLVRPLSPSGPARLASAVRDAAQESSLRPCRTHALRSSEPVKGASSSSARASTSSAVAPALRPA